MAGTAKTRADLEAQSNATFTTGGGAIVAVNHRQYNEDADASALNLEDLADQQIVAKVTFDKEIAPFAVDFAGSAAAPYALGRIIYDENEKTHKAQNDLAGAPLFIGEALRARLTNDTGGTLSKGAAVAITGAVGVNLQVELLDASNLDSSVRALGLIYLDALAGADSYIMRFGAVRDLNTAAFSPGDILYGDPATPGGLINTRPVAPFYPIRIGVCIISHASAGIIGVDTLAFNGTDTTVNIEGTLNGVVVETPAVEFYESGGTIFAEVTNKNQPAQDLAFMLGGMRYLLNTTTGGGPNNGAFAALVPGADAETLFENFIYIWLNVGTPELKISTLSTPDTLAPIGKASIFDVTRTLAEGVYKWRRYNDAPDNAPDDGFNRWTADATRDKLGTTYWDGIDGTPTVTSAPSVKLVTTAGQAMQAHKQPFTLQDGNSYWIYNDETNQAIYEFTADLASIVETAAGATLAVNGAYYRLPVYGMQNSESGGALASPDKLIVTRPLGFYSTEAEAITDAANLDIAPNDIITEGVLFRLYTLVIARTGGAGSVWALVELQDNRTRLVGKGAGGGGAASGGGTDDKVRASATDTTNSYLNDKLVVTSRLSKTTLNPGGNEQLEFDTIVHDYGIIYLDPVGGDDANDGSENFPVENLQEAIDIHELGGGEEIRIKNYSFTEVAEALKSTTSTLIISGQKREYNTDASSRETTITNLRVSAGRVIFKDVKVATLSITQTTTVRVDIEGVRTKIVSFNETINDKQYTSVELYDNSEMDPAGTIDTPISIQDGGKIQIGVLAVLDNVTIGLNSALVCLLPAQANVISTLTIDRGQIAMLASAVLEVDTTFDHTGAVFVNRGQITVTGTETDTTGEFSKQYREAIKVPIGGRGVDHTTGTNKMGFHIDYDFHLETVTLEFDPIEANAGPTGASFIVDINVANIDGTSLATILSTKLSVDAGEYHSSTAAVAAVISTNEIAQYKFISIDIDQIGSTLAGQAGFVTLNGYRT